MPTAKHLLIFEYMYINNVNTEMLYGSKGDAYLR